MGVANGQVEAQADRVVMREEFTLTLKLRLVLRFSFHFSASMGSFEERGLGESMSRNASTLNSNGSDSLCLSGLRGF